jgi:protein transport protein SEC61 subunit alpha
MQPRNVSTFSSSRDVLQRHTAANRLCVHCSASISSILLIILVFGLLITFGQGLAYILGGMYGDVADVGIFNVCLLLGQLMFAGFIVILLDEVLQKGYGFGSGISIFIACNTAESILWRSFSPITIKSEGGNEFEGAIIAFFHLLITRSNKLGAIQSAFFRSHAPNLSSILATVLMILIIIYFQGFRVELTITSTRARGYTQPYPIKLFYTSNMPIIL